MVHILSGRAETPTQSKILASVRDEGPLSRIELADRLEVSRTTVAAEVGRLVELGLAVDAGPAASRGGRRSSSSTSSPRLRFVGIDDRRHRRARSAVTDGRLSVLGPRHQPPATSSRARRPSSPRPRADPQGDGRARGSTAQRASASACPGRSTSSGGVPVSPPIMPGWDGYPVRDALSRELGCPVLLDNDVNVMALGEQHAGVARSRPDFLFVKIGTGIGCGIVVDGELYRGVDGCAGDIGHIRVDDVGPCAPAATRAASRPSSAAPPWPGTRRRRRSRAGPRSSRELARAGRRAHAPPTSACAVAGRRRRRPADPRRRPPRRPGARQTRLVLQPRPDRHRRRRDRPRPLAARRDPQRRSTAGRCRWPPATCRSC